MFQWTSCRLGEWFVFRVALATINELPMKPSKRSGLLMYFPRREYSLFKVVTQS